MSKTYIILSTVILALGLLAAYIITTGGDHGQAPVDGQSQSYQAPAQAMPAPTEAPAANNGPKF